MRIKIEPAGRRCSLITTIKFYGLRTNVIRGEREKQEKVDTKSNINTH